MSAARFTYHAVPFVIGGIVGVLSGPYGWPALFLCTGAVGLLMSVREIAKEAMQ